MRVVSSIVIFCVLVSGFLSPVFAREGGPNKPGKMEWLFERRGVRKNYSFNRPQGMFLDTSRKKVYIADTGNRQIAIFSFFVQGSKDSLGEPSSMSASAEIFQTERPLSSPLGISADSDGKVYISCREKAFLEVFDAKGKFLYPIPSPEFLAKHEFAAGKFVLSQAGKLYATNRKTDEIWVFERNGSFAFRFGGKGSGQGKFQLITDLFFHGEKLYVTDAQGIPLQVFTADGTYLHSFGKHGQSEEDFSFPQAVSVDRSQRIWVADAFRHRVRVYSQEGDFLFGFGTYGTQPGKFCFPVDLDFDDEDRIYILEKSSHRFQVFQIEGLSSQDH